MPPLALLLTALVAGCSPRAAKETDDACGRRRMEVHLSADDADPYAGEDALLSDRECMGACGEIVSAYGHEVTCEGHEPGSEGGVVLYCEFTAYYC